MFKILKSLQSIQLNTDYMKQYGIQFRVGDITYYVKIGAWNMKSLPNFDYVPDGTMVDWWDNEGMYNYEN